MKPDWTAIENAIHAWVLASSGLPADNVVWGGQNGTAPPAPYIELVTGITPVGQDWTDSEVNPLVVADDEVEAVNAGADQLTLTAHDYQTGDGPVQVTTTGTLPAGLAALTDYWVIVDDADTIRLAATYVHAVDGTPLAVDITDTGTGTHTISTTAKALRTGEELIHYTRGVRQLEVVVTVFGGDATQDGATFAIANNVLSSARQPSNIAAFRAAGLGVSTFSPVSRIGLQQALLFEPRSRFTVTGFVASEVTETGAKIESAQIDATLTTSRGPAVQSFYVPDGDPFPP